MMKKWLITTITSLVLGCFSITAFATDLIQVFQQAYVSDPTFQASRSSYMSNKENIPIARSALLPQLNTLGSTQYNHVIDKTTLGGAPTFIPGTNVLVGGGNLNRGSKFDFNSNNLELDLTQTVFNFAEWANLKQAKAGVKAANASFNAAFQSLMSRTSEAYFEVLNAEDNLRFIEAQKAATYRQLDQVQQQFKVGLVAITGVYQAQAAYDNIVAEEIAAQNDIINRREDLRAITGRYYDHLAGLKGDVPLVTPRPSNVEQWVTMGVKQNWTLVAARYNVEAGRQNINVQRAGHLPVVDAFGQIDQVRSGRSPSGHIKTNSNAVGLELNLPIYEGGFVSATTKQARYDWQNDIDQQEQAYRSTVNAVRQSYNNVIAGISKIKADKQAIVSNKASLESTIEAYKVGTQTMLDVLQSQQELFNTLRGFARDQYDYINALIDLKEAAGTLNINDLQKINTWLTENRRSYRFLTTTNLQKKATQKANRQILAPKQQIKELTSPAEQKKHAAEEKQLKSIYEPDTTSKPKQSIKSSGHGSNGATTKSATTNQTVTSPTNGATAIKQNSNVNKATSNGQKVYEKYTPPMNGNGSSTNNN